jgi:hypothetical protein
MIENENPIMPTTTYQGCDCETCKELNVDCPDCPVCSDSSMKIDSEVAMAMYDSSIGKADPCWDGYVQRGMKPGADGNPVPNCVPVAKAAEVVLDLDSFKGIGKDYTRSTREKHSL